ncbi:MAG TPA: hypothetical protein VK255_00345 [Patescibacteria group bacterium]|nr:hypothetical protein [Patescibacteria group bacterium]
MIIKDDRMEKALTAMSAFWSEKDHYSIIAFTVFFSSILSWRQ